jgi:hypothetical protein
MLDLRRTESDSLEHDVQLCLGQSPEARAIAFVNLMATMSRILQSLPPDERWRRLNIARELDPLPNPWWKNFRPEALAEYQCATSSP